MCFWVLKAKQNAPIGAEVHSTDAASHLSHWRAKPENWSGRPHVPLSARPRCDTATLVSSTRTP